VSHAALHPHLLAYLDALRSAGKASTAGCYEPHLRRLTGWLAEQGIATDHVTTNDLARFQGWLATTYRTPRGEMLARSTRGTISAVIRSAYGWMRRRGLILHDPTVALIAPKVPRRLVVAKDHLSQQEAVALMETLAALVGEAKAGTAARALAQRNLAVVAVALASGRRCEGLIEMRVEQIDFVLKEVRVDSEKGKTGRVLPIAQWATTAVRRYLDEGRIHLLAGETSDRVFVSQRRGHLCHKAVGYLIDEAIKETIRRNPDLTELPGKRITTHSLRVSTALLLYRGGCNIRSLQLMLLHAAPTTTSAYTPITVQDLRSAFLVAHPRA